MNPKFISGPPGTGKTHRWLREKYAELLKKFPWNRIVVLSHTNIAAAEIIEAVKKLPELQDVSKEDLEEQICTIHSYCRGLYVHVTKFDKEDHRSLVMSQPLMQRWKKKSWDKHPLYEFTSQAHGKEMSFDDYWKVCDPDSFKPYNLSMLKHLKDAYDKHRVDPETGKILKLSFEDMIDNFLFLGKEPDDIDALIVDEAQDCNKPQIKALHKMATNIKDNNYYFVGDADQTIFEYSGSDPTYFHTLSKDAEELEDGLRCGETINKICKNIIAPIWKHYNYNRVWKPVEGIIGKSYWMPSFSKDSNATEVLLNRIQNTEETFLFTFRGKPSDDHIKNFFYRHGIDFAQVGNSPHISRKVFRCFKTWNKFLNDKVPLQQIKEYWPLMGVRGENGVKVNKMGDVKSLADLINKEYNVEDIISRGLLKSEVKGLKKFEQVLTDPDVSAKVPLIKKILINGTNVEKAPRVEYGNIHQIKGLTRDNSIVDLTITREEQHFFEGLRLAYVAYSRARINCWTVASRMPRLSLGRIENRKGILELNK
jgi:superfamily I DNA/RNA helicase